MWKIQNRKARDRKLFKNRTFHFSKAQMDAIRTTCDDDNVHGLTSGRWRTNDSKRRKNTKGTLDLSRAGELAAYTVIRDYYASNKDTAHYVVSPPDFSLRSEGEYDMGDVPINTGWKTMYSEVKTTTNRMGRHTREVVNRVGRELGYTFQKQKWNDDTQCRELTATFNPASRWYRSANARLLVGCVGTYKRDGGAVITVSNGTFLLPVSQCKWERRNRYDEGDEDLKMVHRDMQCI